MFRINYLIAIFLLCPLLAFLQNKEEIELTEAYQLLEDRYPSLNNSNILQEIQSINLQSLEKENLPNLFLKGDARVQSDNVHLITPEGTPSPIDIDLPLYSAKTYLEGQYALIDGGITDVQKSLSNLNMEADLQAIEVQRFALREQLNGLFLSIIMQRAQSKLLAISLDGLILRKVSLAAGISEGIILESELQKLEVQELEIKAIIENAKFREEGLRLTLASLIGLELSDSVRLVFPILDNPLILPDINRPEQELYKLNQKLILEKGKLIDIQNKAKLYAFAQTGLGYPNPLNFFEDKISPFGLIGLQFQWKITDWNKTNLEKEKLMLEASKLQNHKEAFDFNLESREAHYISEIKRLQNQLTYDAEIADLQKNILTTISTQLDEGMVTTSDYLIQFNKELAARQKIIIHQNELLNTQLNFWNERGGF